MSPLLDVHGLCSGLQSQGTYTLNHTKDFTQTHPLWLIFPSINVKCPCHFKCMALLCKTFYFPGYTPESRASAPKVFGIPKVTWMLISSLGFTLKGKIPTLGPDLWSFPLSLSQAPSLHDQRAFLFCAKKFICTASCYSYFIIPAYRLPDPLQAECLLWEFWEKSSLNKPGIFNNQKCPLSDY